MKNAVADTNTVVSRALFPASTPARALEQLGHTHQLLGSHETIIELYEVIRRDKFSRISLATRNRLADDYVHALRLVDIAEAIVACRHPKDDKFLSLAVNGGATIILTGDNDLLALHPFRHIDILTATQYLDRKIEDDPR